MKVYILKEVETEHYKIGFTKGLVNNRIKSLQTGNPNTIVEYYSAETEYASQVEAALHNFNFINNINGEWFRFSEEELSEVIKMINKIHHNLMFIENNKI